MFCDLLIFRPGWNGPDVGIVTFFHLTEELVQFFLQVGSLNRYPVYFAFFYLVPTCPTQPIKAGINPVQ